MFQLKDYLTSSGKFPDREKKATDDVKINAEDLLSRVNSFLKLLKILTTISSGFRPLKVNKAIKNASATSGHMNGTAIDLSDPDGSIGALIMKHLDLLKTMGLWLEDLSFTPGWVHLDTKPRSKRKYNIFKPK